MSGGSRWVVAVFARVESGTRQETKKQELWCGVFCEVLSGCVPAVSSCVRPTGNEKTFLCCAAAVRAVPHGRSLARITDCHYQAGPAPALQRPGCLHTGHEQLLSHSRLMRVLGVVRSAPAPPVRTAHPPPAHSERRRQRERRKQHAMEKSKVKGSKVQNWELDPKKEMES